LENELLCRLFIPFHDHFQSQLTSANGFLDADLLSDNLRPFARAVQRDHRTHTIGTMAHILGFARPGGTTLAASPLLTEFAQFIASRFGSVPTSEDFVSQIRIVAADYRNRAAHPDIIDVATAQICQQLVRALLPRLLESYPS
jgi:hypothetical protein